MAKIILQFSTENNIGSKILHFYDHVWCSHVDAVMPDGGLLGAKLLGGVCIRKNQGFTKTLTVELPTTPQICDKFYSFCLAQIGKPYDLVSIWAFAIEREIEDDDSWFCSELMIVGLEKAGYFPYPLFTKYNKITPQNLLLLCNAFVPIGDPVSRIA